MAHIVILGAGLTGLSTAYHLEQLGFYDYSIFEKDTTVGGLCRSVTQDGFTFDYTGHLLHIDDPYFKLFLEATLGFTQLGHIARRSFVYSHDTYTHYPYQSNLYGLPIDTIQDCIEGFIKRPQRSKEPRTFYTWVKKHFGVGLGRHFFYPYQEKIFAYPVKKLTASWTGRFVPQTTLNELLSGAITDATSKAVGYNAQFFYPTSGGINTWITHIYNKLKNPVHTGIAAQMIDIVNKRVIFTNGHSQEYTQLVSTLPLDTLLMSLREHTATHLKKAASKLLCTSVVNFNFGVARPDLSQKHWIYFPEAQYPFYRLGFPHNFSAHMAPPGHSSVYGEFSCLRAGQEQLDSTLAQARHKAHTVLGITQADIVTEKVITIKHAYVVYNKWRDDHVPTILKQLEQSTIYSIGRYGQWKYASMQEAVLEGKLTAERIVRL